MNTVGLSSPRTRCRSASLLTPFSILSFISTGSRTRGYSPSASRLVRRHVLYVIFDGWADLICALCLMFSFWFVFCCFANGQWLTANGCFLEFRCKDIALFCINKIKWNYFCLFCKILLEKGDSVMSAIFFCVARKFLPLRHAVIFSMPCAWRGVKEI